MSNRRKSKIEKLFGKQDIPEELNVPVDEKVELKRVPANIKWAEVGGIDREDVEVIGEAVIFDDGTQDVIIWKDISDDAKKLLGNFKGSVGAFSVAEKN